MDIEVLDLDIIDCKETIGCTDNNKVSQLLNRETLRRELIECYIECGAKDDIWIVDDILNVVERFVVSQYGEGKIFQDEEIKNLMVKILEDIGQINVANRFNQRVGGSFDLIEVTKDGIERFLSERLGLKGKVLNIITSKTLRGCAILGIKKRVKSSLILELARFYRSEELKNISINSLIKGMDPNLSPWLLTREKVLEFFSDDILEYVNKGFISIFGISRLFPSFKIDILLEPIVTSLGFRPIITEMVIVPSMQMIGDWLLDGIFKVENSLAFNEDFNKEGRKGIFPIFLKFLDWELFIEKFFGIDKQNRMCKKNIILSIVNFTFGNNPALPIYIKEPNCNKQ